MRAYCPGFGCWAARNSARSAGVMRSLDADILRLASIISGVIVIPFFSDARAAALSTFSHEAAAISSSVYATPTKKAACIKIAGPLAGH